ncbi:T-cell surface glycoprotein CD3 zeta chain [Liparis tanakae]|uniref:T-cell surface glycoprotein CD3 zeta chain n=1 Tax=Liparis tanakae TaxID=230148 RepID=A0A4Z2H5W5_9TELE|nr:T-cell surface glycoprotein CD3 zeta chain [Liparis tanakae]
MDASSDVTFFSDPVICYFLDSILMVYCIVATALFFREKFSNIAIAEPELQKVKDADVYQVLKPPKGKKKAAKKKKSGPAPSETLMPGGSAPPPLPPT